MSTRTASSFESWFEGQKRKGLLDIKLAVSGGKDVSVRAVQQELLKSETLIAAGMCEPLPVAASFVSHDIKALIRSVAI